MVVVCLSVLLVVRSIVPTLYISVKVQLVGQ